MPKSKGDKSFEYGTPPVNSNFGYTKLLLHPMPLAWDFSRVKQFIRNQCESEEIKNAALFLYKEKKDSDCIWIQFDSEHLCKLAYSQLQGIELNGKPVKVEFDKRVKPQRPNFNVNKPPNMNMQNNFNYNNDNYAPPPSGPPPDMGPPSQETFGLSVGFLTSLGIQPPLRNKVFVANLVLTVTERDIENVMSLAGRVTAVTMLKQNGAPRGQAAVEFDHPVEAVQAISMLNNQEFYGRPLVVRMYKNEPKLPLPTGLSSVGMGLGPAGQPMKAVRTTVEILPLKHKLESAIKRLSGEKVDENYATPYGSDVVDNFNPNFGMPPFGMPNGPMPFMPFPPDQMNGPFMPGPMGMPGMPGPCMPPPNMISGPGMGMPGPMPGPNMPMPGPNMPMPGPNMPMPGPNMPMPGPNMPMLGPNMPMPGPNMPVPGTNMPLPAPKDKTPSNPPKRQEKIKNKSTKATLEASSPPSDDIPGLKEVTLPKSPPPLPKSPPPTQSKNKKISISVKSEKLLRAKQNSPEEKPFDVVKWEDIEIPREKSRDRETVSKKSSKSKNGRSESSSPEREPEKSKKADSSDLTDNLLKLFQGDSKKKPNLGALQGFMEQVMSLSKTMSVLKDIVPKDRSPERDRRSSPRRDRRERESSPSPDRDSDQAEKRRDKRTEESSRLSKTISALREKESVLPTNESPKRIPRSGWSPDSNDSAEHEAPRKSAKRELPNIEPPPGKPKEYAPRESEWSARVPPRGAARSPARRRDKRTYVSAMPNEPEPSSRPKARKTEQLPLITASDMLTFTNLPPTVTVAALSAKMRAVGELRFAELTGSGRAVVRFQRVQDAERCIKLFHRSKVDGQIIEVVPY